MKLAGLQKLLVCNPLRVYLQRTFEAPRVFDGLKLARGSSCIEIGSGCGAGALCIKRYFNCGRLIGVDSDPAMIACARDYIAHPPQWARTVSTDTISFACEDATRLPYPGESFAAAFLFGVLNSIQDWQRVIAEAFRVLERGGVFAFKEGLRPETFFHWGRLTGFIPHITENELRTCLTTAGFSISRFDVARHLPGCFVRAIKS